MAALPLSDYITGLLVLAGVAGASLVAAAIVVQRRLGHLTGATRALAFALVALAALIAVHLLPGAAGLLSRWSVLACAAALAGAVTQLVRPVVATPDDAPAAAPGGDRLSWAIAIAAGSALAAWVAGQGFEGTAVPSTGDDSLTFHLPNVAAWIQSGSFWRVDQFTPLQANGNYPHNGDVLYLAVVLPWRSDAFTSLVNPALVGVAGLAAYALAVELRAPRAAAALMAAAFVALPVVGLTVVDGAFTDPLMIAAFGAAVLFMVRHHRTGRRSDLVLAGLGLGFAFGTKWYAVTAVVVALALWSAGSLLAHRAPRAVLRDGATLAGLVLLAGGFWLVRNLAESGNPVMPVKVELLGQTIFGAARDVRDCVGFSIAHYLGSADAWDDYILPGYRHFLSLPGVVLAASGAAATVVALRSRSRVPLALALGALAIAVAYVFTPYTALGLDGAPIAAGGNTRYLLPALFLAAVLGARLGGAPRAIRVAFELAAAAAVADGIRRAYDVPALSLLAGAAIVGLLGAAAYLGTRLRTTAARAVVAVAVAALLAPLGYARQREFQDGRYRGAEPSVDWILAHAPSGHRVGLAGAWDSKGLVPVLPAFGPRLRNRVAYVGEYVDGLLHEYEDRGRFLAAVRRGRFDLLVVGNDDYPAECRLPGSGRLENAWARSAGFELLASSPRLTLYRVP